MRKSRAINESGYSEKVVKSLQTSA